MNNKNNSKALTVAPEDVKQFVLDVITIKTNLLAMKRFFEKIDNDKKIKAHKPANDNAGATVYYTDFGITREYEKQSAIIKKAYEDETDETISMVEIARNYSNWSTRLLKVMNKNESNMNNSVLFDKIIEQYAIVLTAQSIIDECEKQLMGK